MSSNSINSDWCVNVLGLGYIGLPTAAILADTGFQVLGVDINPEIVRTVSAGEVLIQEPGLDALVCSVVKRGKLRAASRLEPANVHIITVPTPIHTNREPNLDYVASASYAVASVLQSGDLVILESTVPPCTCERFIAPIIHKQTGLVHGKDYLLAHCPERVLPGRILYEIIHNDRIVGGTTVAATERTTQLYSTFVRGRILQTNAATAEMSKLMENTFRDVNIALANEFAQIAEDLTIDIYEAITLANHHPRVNIHLPGIGVGGHCIPIDPWFLAHAAPQISPLIQTARQINDHQPHLMVKRISAVMATHPNAPTALLGLSYKADVDDIRESPAIEIVHQIAERFTTPLYIVEPHIQALPPALQSYSHLQLVDAQVVRDKAEIVVSLVAHQAFRSLWIDLEWGNRQVLDLARIGETLLATRK